MTRSSTPLDARTRLRLSRSALIAAAALGPLLVASAVYSQQVVRRAAESVLFAEADGWARMLASRVHGSRGAPPPVVNEALASFLEESREAGLRHVALVARDERIEAGTPRQPFVYSDVTPGVAVWTGERVRFAMPTGIFGGRASAPRLMSPPGDRAHAPGREAGSRPPPAWLVVEFEPRAFRELMAASRRTLALGTLTSVTVVLLAAWVWQSIRRSQAMEREAERARHLAALGEMSAVLAHEIRNPLASIKGHAQLLVEGLAESDRSRGKASRIVDAAVRIEGITTDLLDFVRGGELTRVPTDLGALVRLSVQDIVPSERLRLELPEALAVPLDADRVRQVLENVARNAVQAGEGSIEISARAEGADAVVTVRDHGAGIAPGQEERIFEPFVTTRTRGTGLGLAIARRIVERHGGSLEASNHTDGGAVFRMTLPAAAR
jgi:two-component system sensor histidine kinase HydH